MEELAKVLPKMKKFDAYINDVKKDKAQKTNFDTKQKLQDIRLQNSQLKEAILEMELFLDANGDNIPIKARIQSEMIHKLRKEVGLCM